MNAFCIKFLGEDCTEALPSFCSSLSLQWLHCQPEAPRGAGYVIQAEILFYYKAWKLSKSRNYICFLQQGL